MKYHNRKTTVDGKTFDSMLEAKRYRELNLMEHAGEIFQLELQPVFILIPKFKKNGKTYREVTYRADFAYTDKNDKYIVEDVKGVKTPLYRLKKKLFEYTYPQLEIKEITE